MFVDFTNAFNTIDHQKTFRVMHDQGFPPDAVDVVTGIYTNVTTSVILNEKTGLRTKPIPIGRGTIQGDTLSPLIFILYIEPLVRWLRASGLGYTPSTANHAHPGPLTQSVGGYADDLYLLANTAPALSTQFSKLKAYSAWGGLQPQPKKSAVSGILNHSRATSHVQSVPDMTKILRTQLEGVFKVGETNVPFLPPNKPYKYLGVLTTLTLDFTPHFEATMSAIKLMGRQLLASAASPMQCLRTIKHVLKPKIAYGFPAAPFSPRDITLLDQLLVQITKACLNLGKSFPHKVVLCPEQRFGVGLHSLKTEYVTTTATRSNRNSNAHPGHQQQR